MIPTDKRERFERNISVLAKFDSQLAEKIRKVSLPDDLKFISAVDGTITAFSPVLSKSGWFAGTSVPYIRESVIMEKFAPENSNVLLPGTGQGVGIQILLEKLSAYQAIFVLEQHLLNIALMFFLYDFSKAIEDGRLIFLAGTDIEKCLNEFFARHKEYAFPEKAIHWPWIPMRKMQEIALSIERAFANITREQNKSMSELEAELEKKLADKKSDNGRMYIISLASTSGYFRFAKSLAISSESLGYQTETYLFDTPKHGTHLALLKSLVELVPDKIISVGLAKNNMPFKLPDGIDMISVLSLPGDRLNIENAENIKIGLNERFVIGSEDDAQILANNIPADRLRVIDIAVDDVTFKPASVEPDIDVAVFADRPDDDPEKYGIRQSSHKRLWQAVSDIISKNAIDFFGGETEQAVRQACKVSGVEIHSQELFDSFTDIVRKTLAKAVVASTICGKLVNSNLKVSIFGDGWGKGACELPDDPNKLNEIFASAKIILFIDSETNYRQIVFDSICAGKIVVVKPIKDDKIFTLREISGALIPLDASESLISRINGIIGNYKQLESSAREASEFLKSHYSFKRIFECFDNG